MNINISSGTRIEYERVLNEEQLRVIREGEGPVLVLAGAGSGKTRVLTYRAASLIERGIDPHSICLLTFTNKAAREMVLRIERILGAMPQGLLAGTFHHAANFFLRRYARYVNLPSNYLILDQEDATSLIKAIAKEAIPDMRVSAEAVREIIGLSACGEESIRDVVMNRYMELSGFIPQIESIAQAYEKKKRALGVVDYDDLLLFWKKLLSQENTGHKISERFRHILVDEYQDTNRIQAIILYQLARAHRNIMVVGDDAQSIYSFRGATVQNILEFPKIFPDARIFYLETNYRSTPEILSLANDVIARNRFQFPKVLRSVRSSGVKPVLVCCRDRKSEAVFVSQRINQLLAGGVKPQEIGVLFRSRYQAAELEIELNKLRVAYVIRGGLRFFEQAHIKDIMAFLRILENPKDELSWTRIIKLGAGIGKVSQERILALVRQEKDLKGMLDNWRDLSLLKSARHSWEKLCDLIREICADMAPVEKIRIIRQRIYNAYLIAAYPDAVERGQDLDSLEEIASECGDASALLNQASLQEQYRGEPGAGSIPHIALSTIHQAKGLEWNIVFIIGICAYHFPHNLSVNDINSLEEERRIFYVGLTRAKEDLYLSYFVSDYFRNITYRKSLFIEEMNLKNVEVWNF